MPAQPIKTFIVDDDETILTLLEEVFRNDPLLDITTFSDSKKALDVLKVEPVDLLITDLMMPHVDGLALLERAHKTHAETLVVVITGYASLDTTLQAIHAGVYDYITKPFRIEEFRLLVDNAEARIQLLKENERLQAENAEMLRRLEHQEGVLKHHVEELHQLYEELGRRQQLLTQTGGAGKQKRERAPRERLTVYEKDLESSEQRYGRKISDLEELFSSGNLTSEEFEVARQRLKTMI